MTLSSSNLRALALCLAIGVASSCSDSAAPSGPSTSPVAAVPSSPAPTVVSVDVSGPGCTVEPCIIRSLGWHKFGATATWSDGSTSEVSEQATWNSTNWDVIGVNASGLLTVKAYGSSDVTATYRGRLAGRTVTVIKPTFIMNVTGDLAFGQVPVGSRSTKRMTIWNLGNSSWAVREILYPAGFAGAWSGQVAPAATQVIDVTFAPMRVGTHSGWVLIDSQADGPCVLAISGYGTVSAGLISDGGVDR